MNTPQDNNGNSTPLDQELAELGQAYQKLEPDTPPELLDQAILNLAHREVAKKPGWMQFGWLHGLTTAAVFVLAFSIILNQRQSTPEDVLTNSEITPAVLQSKTVGKSRQAPTAPAVEEEQDNDSRDREALFELAQPDAAALRLEDRSMRLPAGQPMEVPLKEEAVEADREDNLDEIKSRRASEPMAADFASILAESEFVENEAAQELAEIMQLKEAGDESWRKALELFIEQYPDYPLPGDLQD